MSLRKRKPVSYDPPSDIEAPTKKAARRKSTKTAKKAPAPVTPSEITAYTAKLATSEHTHIQTRCQGYMVAKYPSFVDKCASCIERQVISGGCRFEGLRVFKVVKGKIDFKDYAFRSNLESTPGSANVDGKAHGRGKRASKKAAVRQQPKKSTGSNAEANVVVIDTDEEEGEPSTMARRTGSSAAGSSPAVSSIVAAPPTSADFKADADYVLPLIAPSFAEQLRREKRHEYAHLELPMEGVELPGSPRPLIRILQSPDTRSLCDACATSIYMGSYLCGCCGLEYCLGCWEEWESSDDRESGRLRSRDGCSKKRRHTRKSMIFVTRAGEGEVARLLERVERRIPSAEKLEQEDDDAKFGLESIPTSQPTWPDDQGPEYLPTPKTHYSEITLPQFQALWRKGGIPLVLTGFIDRFKLPWDPNYFIEHHGDETCYIHDCISNAAISTTVAAFFSKFSDPTSTHSHKLKDWPPSDEFSTTFPALFADFEGALPFPSYTARKGTLNLAAHFPPSYNAPDLGPKMYNAYPAPDFLPSFPPGDPISGTTNLHLDLTDAMNIMLFSAGGTLAPDTSTIPKAIPHCGAIWDIFPPSASAHIRTYLNSPAYLDQHQGAIPLDDPIHRQTYYLSESDLTVLWHEYGVRSHRIFQEPGDAVFVPAGCAHQVRNRKSCVKVAVDFLTPENVGVCHGLLEEARKMAGGWGKGRRGKEDVLQLWGCLGFAWGAYDVGGEGDKGKEGVKENGVKDEVVKEEGAKEEAVKEKIGEKANEPEDTEMSDAKEDIKDESKEAQEKVEETPVLQDVEATKPTIDETKLPIEDAHPAISETKIEQVLEKHTKTAEQAPVRTEVEIANTEKLADLAVAGESGAVINT